MQGLVDGDSGLAPAAAPRIFLRVKRQRAPDVVDDESTHHELLVLKCLDLQFPGSPGELSHHAFKRVVSNCDTKPSIKECSLTIGNIEPDVASLERKVNLMSLSSPDAKKHSVKKVPSTAELVQADKQRKRNDAIRSRATLRCERIGKLRSGTEIVIDAVIDSFASNSSDNVWDLYLLQSEESSNYDCESWDEEEAELIFDDEHDEFSFEVVPQRSSQRLAAKKRRSRFKNLASALECEVLNLPNANDWVLYDDCDGLVLAGNSALVLDREQCGLDNYVYYDHRHDDEYDSNAEDHDGNDYPDESSSSGRSSGGGVGYDRGDYFSSCSSDDGGEQEYHRRDDDDES